MRTRLSLLAIVLASCAPAARQGTAPSPSAPPAAPDTSERRAVARLDTVPPDTMVSYRVPAFRPLPLVTWGAPPPGTAHAARERTYDLQHQVVHVHFDWTRHTVVGATMLRVSALPGHPLSDVALDAIGMTIRAVRDATGRPLRHDYDGHTLTVHLSSPIRPGRTASFTVAYEAVQPKKGAYF